MILVIKITIKPILDQPIPKIWALTTNCDETLSDASVHCTAVALLATQVLLEYVQSESF